MAIDDRAHPQRLLVLADDLASFFILQGENNLVEDTTLPRYQRAKLARFAPKRGRQAAIVDELGIHFVSMETGQESIFISQENIDAFKYSPDDNYVVTCEKFNSNMPENTNLRIIEAATGRISAQFVWSRPAKESLKTIVWSTDESICLRVVQPEGAGQPN